MLGAAGNRQQLRVVGDILAREPHDPVRKILRPVLAFELCAWLVFALPVRAADLQPATLEAFNHYVRLAEAEADSMHHSGAPFLWIDRLPPARRDAAHSDLRAGKIVIECLETLDNGRPIHVPDGMIHHWIGTVFIPGATLAETLALEKDYDRHQDFFQPDVVKSKVLERDGDDFEVLLRFYKKKVVTAVTETEHAVHYQSVDASRAWSQSHTTRIQEVENAGKANERLLPEGHDRGFLWRMNTYWRFEEKDRGTYVESQSISLTRDIPTGLGWLIGSYVTSVPRESLSFTLTATRAAVLARGKTKS